MENEDMELLEENEEFDESLSEIKEIPPDDDEVLRKLKRATRGRLHRKFDAVYCISGDDTGIGKSSLGINIGMGVDHSFSLLKNIAYLANENEIKSKFRDVSTYGCFDVDEAVKSFYKLNWADRMQKLLNQDFMTNRKGHYKCTLLMMPRFIDLNEFFRNYKVKLNIHIPVRGLAIIYAKNKIPTSRDPWNIDENYKLMMAAVRNKKWAEIEINDLEKILKRSRNYVGAFRFPPLDSKIEEEYLEIFNSEKAREERELASLEVENNTSGRIEPMINLGKVINYVTGRFEITQKEISENTGVGMMAISMALKRAGLDRVSLKLKSIEEKKALNSEKQI